jgi:hypothetical protein
VLVHPHTEITDARLCDKVRAALEDADVAVVGCAGATGVRSIAWWEGTVTAARMTQRYDEYGGGTMPAYSWTAHTPPPAEVDALDGQLLVLSPWAVHNVRFDEELILNHGFDLDFCLQVRAAGRKLVVADLHAVHHRSVELVNDLPLWVEAHIQLAEKWDHDLHGEVAGEDGWKQRARRAEADREAARAIAFSKSLKLDAHVLELERELEEKTESISWRATAPLRAVNHLRRNAASRRRARAGSRPSPPPTATGQPPLAPVAATDARRPRTHSSRASGEAPPPSELDAPARSTT